MRLHDRFRLRAAALSLAAVSLVGAMACGEGNGEGGEEGGQMQEEGGGQEED
ncbi:MAG: hypothetical protein M3O70_11320 [Actinomycetota bacterium]|nr:hypothetical protein [Actinomycetota bacterium]